MGKICTPTDLITKWRETRFRRSCFMPCAILESHWREHEDGISVRRAIFTVITWCTFGPEHKAMHIY